MAIPLNVHFLPTFPLLGTHLLVPNSFYACMPTVGRTSSHERRQQYESYTNGLWGEMPPRDVYDGTMFDDQSHLFLNTYTGNLPPVAYNFAAHGGPNLVHDLRVGVPGSSAPAVGQTPTPIPLPLPTPIQADARLSLVAASGGTGETEPQATWNEGVVDLSRRVSEIQLESLAPAASGSDSGMQQAEQRRARKKEESGVCDLCNRWFSRRSDVRRHKNTAHAKKVHACPQCHIVCSRKDALQRHIRDQH
ncbi:hypothetical protein BJV78DRAFT_86055 [Lactifluus subvellereus]|nr:hypothetical protein BJV78DRAFT_86055 [Lactifluus subvellereus]